ncbi:MAG: inositol monophosphatase [Candidatus Aenigmarchaeota archaeon]|nr:inositol monophosphatase [Candidatus Aenigmarchaeota archaeon]
MKDLKEYEKFAIETAKEAWELIKNTGSEIVEMKKGIDFSTVADIESEKLIISKIKERFPEHAILAEESGESDTKSDFVWVIDPLDGTKNFKRKIPLFCISISLKYKNEPIVGVIFDPNTDKMYHASKGNGAFVNGNPIRVSDINNLKESYVCIDISDLDIPNEEKEIELRILQKFIEESGRIRSYGTMLAACFIAEGGLEAYFDPNGTVKETDFSAAIVLVKEAGGFVSFEKNPINNEKRHLLITNNSVNEDVFKALKA